MPKHISSTCIQHPGFQALGRCKQCGKPFCSQCEIKGPTGVFCCAPCKANHEAFTQRAAQLDAMAKKTSISSKLFGAIKTIIGLGVLAALIGVSVHFFNIEVPIISDFIRSKTQ